MIQLSNLPVLAGVYSAFFDSQFSYRGTFEDGFDVAGIHIKVTDVPQPEKQPEVTFTGQVMLITFAPEQMRLMPKAFDVVVYKADTALMMIQVKVLRTPGTPTTVSQDVILGPDRPSANIGLAWKGDDGVDGKDPLDYAQESGWPGTGEQFANAFAGMVENITVATYAAAVPYFTGAVERKINVEADEAYNDGDPSHYTYHPALGVAFFGLDYNYTEE